MARSSTHSSLAGIREANTRTVVDAVFADESSVALSELVDLTGLSRPTLTQTLRLMTAIGLVTHGSDRPASGIGRPLSVYRPLPEHHELCVVVVGFHWVEVAVADVFGRVILTEREDLVTGVPLAQQVAAVLERTIDGRRTTTMGAVIAVMGIVHQGGVVHSSRHPELGDPATIEAIRAPILSRWPEADIVVRNDAKLAAEWMYRRASASGAEVGLVLAVHMNVSVGCGIVIDGQILEGAHGAAGEVYLESDNKFHEAERALWTGIERLGRSVHQIYRDAGQGDPEAQEVTSQMATCVAHGLRPIVLALDPDTVLVGGPLAQAGQSLRDVFEKEIREVSLTAPKVLLSPDSETAVRDGAMMVAIDRMRDRLVEQLVSRAGASTTRRRET